MQSITVKELLAAVRGTLVRGSESAVIRAVSTDSRTVREGELFIPVKGERFDGHDYIESALQNGAAGCLFIILTCIVSAPRRRWTRSDMRIMCMAMASA